MEDTASLLISAQVLEIAGKLRLAEARRIGATAENISTNLPMKRFLPEAVEIFMARHEEIQRLIAVRQKR